jgi:hypothetical protein
MGRFVQKEPHRVFIYGDYQISIGRADGPYINGYVINIPKGDGTEFFSSAATGDCMKAALSYRETIKWVIDVLERDGS